MKGPIKIGQLIGAICKATYYLERAFPFHLELLLKGIVQLAIVMEHQVSLFDSFIFDLLIHLLESSTLHLLIVLQCAHPVQFDSLQI